MGISGVGVAVATAGGWLLYAGLKNIPAISGLRDLIGGKIPTPAQTLFAELPDSTGLSNYGADSVSATALKYQGVKYKFGGAQNPTVGFDCSGLVNWVLGHDLGMTLPGSSGPGFSGSTHGPIVGQYYVWGGAYTIPKNQAAAGDLVVYGPNEHIGIYLGDGNMVDAPTFGEVVQRQAVWGSPIYRRIGNASIQRNINTEQRTQ